MALYWRMKRDPPRILGQSLTSLMDESGAMLWGRITYEMMESYWPTVPRRRGGAAGDARLGCKAGRQAEVRGVIDTNGLPVEK
jgi:hypothetical protein